MPAGGVEQLCWWDLGGAAWLLSALSESPGRCDPWILRRELSVLGCCLLPGGEIISTRSVLSLQARWDPSVMQELLRRGGAALSLLTSLAPPPQVEGTMQP